MGETITFYSLKGGAGRTMAVANIAVLLGSWGYKTLVMDWDLESPGLGTYFEDYLSRQWRENSGILDLLTYQQDNTLFSFNQPEWKELVISLKVGDGDLHFIGPGVMNESYFSRLRNLDLEEFYKKNGGLVIEWLRQQWKDCYDFILIDCESGVTDVSGISTIQLPDILVLFFTANKQSVHGAIDIANRVMTSREKLTVDRPALRSVPILSKVDSDQELLSLWLDRVTDEVKSIYANWLPVSFDRRQVLNLTKLPYVSHNSFGEHLPVLEEPINSGNGLPFAYAIVAGLLVRELETLDELVTSPEKFVQKSSKAERLAESKKTKPQAFLSYASEDFGKAKRIYDELSARGVNVWFDKANLRVGQWKPQIEKAIASSRYFIICVSHHTLRKTGDNPEFQDHELGVAFSIAVQQPESKFTIVPVRLEDCSLGDLRMSGYQQYDLFMDFEANLEALAASLV